MSMPLSSSIDRFYTKCNRVRSFNQNSIACLANAMVLYYVHE